MILAGLLALAAAASPAAPGAEALAEGDAHYARRAEGAHGGTCDPAHIDTAIFDYRRALAAGPDSYPARLGLLRAFFFRGGFCGLPDPDKVKVFEEAKRLAEETVARLDRDAGRVKGHVQVEAARGIAPSAQVYLWAAIAWGQWSVDHKVAAAWQGAAARIRDLATAALEIDPAVEQAGAHLLLGRLHAEAPRIPMLTMWISRAKALEHLRAGVALAPENRACQYFLADALLQLSPASREEALGLLRRTATQPPRPDFAVEDAHYAELAERRLAGLR